LQSVSNFIIINVTKQKHHLTKESVMNNLVKTQEDLNNLIPQFQKPAIDFVLKGEDKAYMKDKLKDIQQFASEAPVTYETDGVEDKTCYLHYFGGAFDAYIVELDTSGIDQQKQAFGYVSVNNGVNYELGYIDLKNLLRIKGVELDLHFTPTKASELNKGF
jgi:methyl coenzyme M reductase subunit C-like uncharacterized protein (methanogenesis marker protein 7)